MLAIFQPQGEPLAKNKEPLAKNSHTIEELKGQQANAERADKAKANSGVKLRNCFGTPLNMGKSRFLSCHRVYIMSPRCPNYCEMVDSLWQKYR